MVTSLNRERWTVAGYCVALVGIIALAAISGDSLSDDLLQLIVQQIEN